MIIGNVLCTDPFGRTQLLETKIKFVQHKSYIKKVLILTYKFEYHLRFLGGIVGVQLRMHTSACGRRLFLFFKKLYIYIKVTKKSVTVNYLVWK